MPSLPTQNLELVVLALVLLADYLLPLAYRFSPAFAMRQLAHALSLKLVKKQSLTQLHLSGYLALITYLVLIGILMAAILFIAPDDIWTEGILLYFSLGYQACARQLKQLQTCIAHQQKSAARSLLAKLSEYNTDKLSILGLNKLSVEVATQRFVSEWLMPVVLFLSLGGIAAFLFRALVEAHKAWVPSSPQHQAFGRGAFQSKNMLELLPTWLIAPIYSVFKSSPGWFSLVRSARPVWRQSAVSSFNHLVWLSIVSAGCKSELAGPVMLKQHKHRRPRLNQGLPINDKAITQILNWNLRFQTFILIFLLTLLFLLGTKQ